ncbi:unnamed protein product [Rotaria sp. Silwood1]|nr:unnamed protein product [Rotaria sp. Silwood1]CAF1639621.1 unnamed protein product [Rotaria sp. Silwood1]CAF3847805.1 unnamed protein product [Rotaria sp. Silwood1]CAF3857653.1 unnamed protein product [Rotaria sp. Silwood1]CAF3984477.1 unnamed protein product [Rotaria sp. Silwood1]
MGGMVTAAYLTKYFSRITIIESDNIQDDTLMKSTSSEILDYRCRLESPTSVGRSGVSQIYQTHVMEGEGHEILRELFPQLDNKLLNEYDIRNYSLKTELRFFVNGILLNQNLTKDIEWLGADRFTLETVLRKELCLQFENQIEWKCNSRVTQLIVDQSSNIVKGIKYRCKQTVGSPLFDMYGDFIIDCSGRNSSSTKWLKESLNLIVPTEQMHFGCGYVTFVGERLKTGNPKLDSIPVICSTVNAPDKNAGCYIVPMRTIKTSDENSLGTLAQISIHCVNSEFPPNDSYENLLEWIKENLDPDYYTILKSTKVYSPLIPYHRAIDDRKYVELLGKKWPQNYILLGDAMCTFNPQFGQGMTHACRQARELSKIFAENCHKLKDISHIFNSRASAISEECWLLSTTNDWKTPTLKIIKTDKNGQTKTYQRNGDFPATKDNQLRLPLLTKILQWYIGSFLKCASKSGQLSTDFLHVMNQQTSPFILFKPTILFTVCYTALMNCFNLSKK